MVVSMATRGEANRRLGHVDSPTRCAAEPRGRGEIAALTASGVDHACGPRRCEHRCNSVDYRAVQICVEHRATGAHHCLVVTRGSALEPATREEVDVAVFGAIEMMTV